MRNLLLKHHNNEFCVEMICNVVIALSMHGKRETFFVVEELIQLN